MLTSIAHGLAIGAQKPIISCACFSMTGNGPSAAEFPVMLKQAHDIFLPNAKSQQNVLASPLSTLYFELSGGGVQYPPPP